MSIRKVLIERQNILDGQKPVYLKFPPIGYQPYVMFKGKMDYLVGMLRECPRRQEV